MKHKLNVPTLILSASLLSGMGTSNAQEWMSPIEKTKEKTFQILSGKENMKRLREEIEKNVTTYRIRKGDTIASISDHFGIHTEELLDLNAFLDKSLVRKGKHGTNILIKPGQVLFIPDDKDLFRKHIDRIAEYARVGKLNQKVLAGKIDEIDIEPIFASSVRSIGLPNCLSGFIESQKMSYDPSLPRVVDRSRESQVTCANAMRTLMGQCMNIVDLAPKEQAFQRKQNVDAWMLPTELMTIGYEQKFGEIIRTMFDPHAIGTIDPIKKEKVTEYRETIRAMNAYLEKNGDSLAGSYVPYYFKRSHFKDVVAEYNRSRKDKHYNTHQSMFAGNTTISFGAWNVPLIREGKMEPFGANKKNTLAEIERLRKELIQLQSDRGNNIQKIIVSSQPGNNPEMAKKLSRYERVFEPILKASPKPLSEEVKWEKREQIIALLKEWNNTKQDAIIAKIQKITPWYKLAPSDLVYLGSFVTHHYELKRFIGIFQKTISDAADEPIDGSKFGVSIDQNNQIQQAIQQYNTWLDRINKIQVSIPLKEALLKKPQEAIPAIDFIVNFIQSRADFGGALSDGFRKEIFNGLSLYGDLIHITVNGKPMDVMHELEIYKADRKKSISVFPEDSIEISGPMMIDGEKQTTHPDISRQIAMNIRTRFFFEFFLSETYFPSELLIPGKTSSYARREFSNHAGKLKIKGIYGLRMKYNAEWEIMRNKNSQTLSENIEEVLHREIIGYENLNPDDPKFTEKLRRYYAIQIKALQIAGFLQDENTLNRSAVNINRAIPYYDPSNVSEVFSSYIRMKKQEMQDENTRLAEIKNFINIRTLPGDTYRQIFSSIVKYTISLGEAGQSYPHIRELSRLQDYKKRVFVERFLKSASHEKEFDARKFLESPKPYKAFILSLDTLESILGEMADISYLPSFPWLSEVDQKVIELVTSDESYRQMLGNILAKESYGDSGDMFSRKNLKKLGKKIWFGSSNGDYQLRISSLFADLENEKMLEISLNQIFRTLSDPEVQSFLDSFEPSIQAQIKQDLLHIEAIKKIVTSSKGTKLPRKTLSDELASVIRFDDGDGSNVIGKLISASLLIDKLALHSEKLDYMLLSAGYDLATVFDNPIAMQQYERTIVRINNLPENHMLLALAENFILRISEWLTGTKISTESVFDTSFFSTGKYLGQIKYNKNVFLQHIWSYHRTIEPGKSNPKINILLKKLDTLVMNMEEHPNNTNENIYIFLRDKELRSMLISEEIDISLLPQEGEWNKDPFRNSIFHYVNKMDELRKRKISRQ